MSESEAWQNYWDSRLDIDVQHDAGSDNEEDCKFRAYIAGDKGPTFICFHGAGHTSLSWSLVAKLLKDRFRVIAFDCRGHGATTTSLNEDLSCDNLIKDGVAVIAALQKQLGDFSHVILAGHSMGGAIATRVGATGKISRLEGLVVFDVVEGTAMSALSHMQLLLAKWPKSFTSIDAAIQWSHHSGNVRNTESAKVSVPPQLVQKDDGIFYWRVNLSASEPHWRGWYQGMSDLFLSVNASKVLILAGTDRLDKSLTIGQMQGKYQMLVFPAVGHVVMEDDPARTAEALANFADRQCASTSMQTIVLPGGKVIQVRGAAPKPTPSTPAPH